MSKPPGYRYGSWLVFHGSGAHLVGFSTTYWLSRDNNDTMGLWYMCKQSRCGSLASVDVPDWLLLPRILACVGVVLIAMWLVTGCQCRILKTHQKRHRWLIRLEELFAISAGVCALLSVGVFAVASAGDLTLKGFNLSWSLWLVVAGASASTMGGFIVASTRCPTHPTPKPSSSRTIRPSNPLTHDDPVSQPRQTGRGEQSRQQSDIASIFNVTSVVRSNEIVGAQNNSTLYWVDYGQPPPYSFNNLGCDAASPPFGTMANNSLSRQCMGDNPSTQGYLLDFGRPPPYEAVIHEPPPPYYPYPTVLVSSLSENSH